MDSSEDRLRSIGVYAWLVAVSCAFEALSAVLTARAVRALPFVTTVTALELALSLLPGLRSGLVLPASFGAALVLAINSVAFTAVMSPAVPTLFDVGAILRRSEQTFRELRAALSTLLGAPAKAVLLTPQPPIVAFRNVDRGLVLARWAGLETFGSAALITASPFSGALVVAVAALAFLLIDAVSTAEGDLGVFTLPLCLGVASLASLSSVWTTACAKNSPASLVSLSLLAAFLILPYALAIDLPELARIKHPPHFLIFVLAAAAGHFKRELRLKLNALLDASTPGTAATLAALRTTSAALALIVFDV